MPPRTRSARRLPWLAAWLLGAGQELAAQPARFVPNPPAAGARWLKGNTHTHTTNSDGDTPPEQDFTPVEGNLEDVYFSTLAATRAAA